MSDHVLVPEDDVKHVLDLLASSLDWGSGFLCDEDVSAWNRLADSCGVPRAVKVFSYGCWTWSVEGSAGHEEKVERTRKWFEEQAYRTFDPDVVPMQLYAWRRRAVATSAMISVPIASVGQVEIKWLDDRLLQKDVL